MNDSDTELVDRSVVKNKDSYMHVDEEPETTSHDAHSNLIPTHLPIQAVVRQDVFLRKNQVMMNHSLH